MDDFIVIPTADALCGSHACQHKFQLFFSQEVRIILSTGPIFTRIFRRAFYALCRNTSKSLTVSEYIKVFRRPRVARKHLNQTFCWQRNIQLTCTITWPQSSGFSAVVSPKYFGAFRVDQWLRIVTATSIERLSGYMSAIKNCLKNVNSCVRWKSVNCADIHRNDTEYLPCIQNESRPLTNVSDFFCTLCNDSSLKFELSLWSITKGINEIGGLLNSTNESHF